MHCKRKLGSLSTYAIADLLRWVIHLPQEVQAHAQRTSVAEACRTFHISRPTFYAWQEGTPGCITYKTQWYEMPGGVKGQVVGVKEWDGLLLILGQDQVLTTYPLLPQL